ncbi:uncharacterized protein [Rutidosis leptorrhynchoides]|uniref:uncharacterized protein n=1 Tax=Rutidosis leptorrhynchoides TaxID=125765 RepID=UPI003A98E56E
MATMSNDDSQPPSSQQSQIDELTSQLENLLKNNYQQPKISDTLKIGLSLNSSNFALWSRMMRVAIGGKSKVLLKHLTSNPLDNSHEEFEQWEQEDLIVFSWLIQNIEPNLASNLTSFSTAKLLWDALATTYSSGTDKLQTYDLYVKATEMKQNNLNLEELWIRMQGIWGELEIRDPNPMESASDINKYNMIRAEQKLFQFLKALDQKYDTIKRELLRLNPLPTAEEAYAAVRKETAHRQILGLSPSDSLTNHGIATGLVTIDGKESSVHLTKTHRSGYQPRIDKSKLKCTRCGKSKHTIDQCFEIKGYPEWWPKPIKGKASTAAASGESNTTTTSDGFGGIATTHKTAGINLKPFSSLFTNTEKATRIKSKRDNSVKASRKDAIPLFDVNGKKGNSSPNFLKENKRTNGKRNRFPRLGGLKPVGLNLNKLTKEGWVKEGPTMYVNSPDCTKVKIGPQFGSNINKNIKTESNFVPCQNKYSVLTKIQKDLSEANIVSNDSKSKSWIFDCGATDTMTFDENDIIFKTKPKKNRIQTANGEIIQVKSGGTIEISQTIKLPNCLYIPALSHKLLSDIRTGLLIGRGTEKGGLYYVDEVSQQGTVSLAHGTPSREAWLWHRRLGHPHRSTFKPSNTRQDVPFALIHSDVWGPAPVTGGKIFGTLSCLLMIIQG